MISQLTKEHSIYTCDEQKLSQFISLYELYTPSLPPIDITPLSEIDSIATVFNQWIAVNSYNSRPVMKMSKYFTHSFSYYVYALLDFDIEAQQFIEKHKEDQRMLFIFSYYCSKKTLQLLMQLLIENERDDILKSLKKFSYFATEDPINTPNDFLQRAYFKNSKDMARYFAHDYKNNYRYKYCIDHAIQLANTTEYLTI